MIIRQVYGITKQEAREKIDEVVGELISQYGGGLSDFHKSWTEDTMEFSLSVAGFRLNGDVVLGDSDLAIDISVPITLRPFESTMKAKIEEELANMFAL